VKVEQESFIIFPFCGSSCRWTLITSSAEGVMLLRGIFLQSLPRSLLFYKSTSSTVRFSIRNSADAILSPNRKNGKSVILAGFSIVCTLYYGACNGKAVASCESSQIVLERNRLHEDDVCTVVSLSPQDEEIQESSLFLFWDRFLRSVSGSVSSVFHYFTYFNRILSYFFYAFPLGVLLPANYLLGHQFPSLENITWNYFTFAIQSLGPCFIKLAQWASTRPDLFPLSLISNLESLQDRVKFVQSREMIERTLTEAFHDDNGNENWRKSLVSIDYDRPLGTGSVAQVFRGTLRRELPTNISSKGSVSSHVTSYETIPVAIKMIHPHVEKLIMTDMALLEIFADFLDRFPSLEILSIGKFISLILYYFGSFVDVVCLFFSFSFSFFFFFFSSFFFFFSFPYLGETCREFSVVMKQQLDLRYEANHLLKFNDNFENDNHWAIFPKPIPGFVRRNILVETLMNGFPINTFMKLPDEKDGALVDPSVRKTLGIASKASIKDLKLKLSDLGCRLIIKMIFFDNYIHGDLHPGKIDDYGAVFTFVSFFFSFPVLSLGFDKSLSLYSFPCFT
jgi:hypothetical protein